MPKLRHFGWFSNYVIKKYIFNFLSFIGSKACIANCSPTLVGADLLSYVLCLLTRQDSFRYDQVQSSFISFLLLTVISLLQTNSDIVILFKQIKIYHGAHFALLENMPRLQFEPRQEFSFKKRLDNKLGFYSELWLATIKIPNYRTRSCSPPKSSFYTCL